MSVTLSSQSLISVDEALSYLQDQGSPANDQDLLKHHMNGVAAMMVKLTSRDRLLWVDNDTITEFRDGDGSNRLFLRNAPVRKIASVTISPHASSATALVVPVEPATYSDDLYFDPTLGALILKNRSYPEGQSTVKIEYEAGYLTSDQEYLELKMVALNALARAWARWKNQKHGIASESRGEQSVTYTAESMTKAEIAELRRYRRHLFA